MECFMNNIMSKVLASSKILILWNNTQNHPTAWVPWWQLQVWGQWDREQMPRLWIVSLQPANSEYEPQEWALILEQDGTVGSSPNSIRSRPEWAAVFLAAQGSPNPTLPSFYYRPLPLRIPQRLRQQVFLGCWPHPRRFGGGGFETSLGYI